MKDPSPHPRIFRFGVFELDAASGELRRKGVKIKLQKQPSDVLTMLLERRGEVVTREELREKLWPGQTFVDFDLGVNNAVRKVREALGDSAQAPRYIETLPQRGYRFIAPLAGAAPASSRRPRAFYAAYGAVGVTVLLLLAYLGGFFRRGVSPGEIEAVAVIPFENLSKDADHEYFADGVTDALITELGRIGALRVISRQSVMQYKRVKKPLPEIISELKVDAVVEGTVQRAGDRVQITAQLVRARPEQHLWAESYERRYADILAVQGEIARTVARQVKAKLSPEQERSLARTRIVNPEAYEAYLRGKHLFYGYTPERLHKAIESFKTAIEKDPNFAEAWAELSPAYGALGYWGHVRPSETHPKAKAAARRAVELDDMLGEGHCHVGAGAAYADWDWATAERELRRAIELNPSHAEARANYGMVLGSLRRTQEAMEQFRIARDLDPLQPVRNGQVAWCHYISGQYQQAVGQLKHVVELAPDFFINHWFYWRVLHRTGQDAAALGECERMYELLGDAEVVEALERGERRSGYAGAMKEAAQTLVRRSKISYVPGSQLALLLIHAGENERALEWLENAYQERDPRLHMVWADPDWEPLYSKPRFQSLLRKMGFPSIEKSAAWSRQAPYL
ncbi:MAG: winged helix-turn-helix domain-containing tetratricopeptide repeat protein [Bryobacteraceae bacterium]